jgi:hypothetical protein
MNSGDLFLWTDDAWKAYATAKSEPLLECVNGQEDLLEEYYGISTFGVGIPGFLEKYGFDYLFVLPSEDGLLQYLEDSPEYACVAESSTTAECLGQEIPAWHLFKHMEN